MTAQTSTSILASWQLPPANSRNGIITGFRLSYKKKDPVGSPKITLTINDAAIRNKTVIGLVKYTEYEFQVLAFTSAGNGPMSSVRVVTTKEGGNFYFEGLLTKSSNTLLFAIFNRMVE